jgi:hypothetical protein
MEYNEFLDAKKITEYGDGFVPDSVNENLFGFQKDITYIACRRGRSAVFSNCGTGKTAIQLSWADKVHNHTAKIFLSWHRLLFHAKLWARD